MAAPECPTYTKYTDGTHSSTHKFSYFWKSQTTATNYNATFYYAWCEISSSHAYWDYIHPNLTLTNMSKCVGFTCTTIPSISYYDYTTSRAAEHCMYSIPPNNINIAYLNKVACN